MYGEEERVKEMGQGYTVGLTRCLIVFSKVCETNYNIPIFNKFECNYYAFCYISYSPLYVWIISQYKKKEKLTELFGKHFLSVEV